MVFSEKIKITHKKKLPYKIRTRSWKMPQNSPLQNDKHTIRNLLAQILLYKKNDFFNRWRSPFCRGNGGGVMYLRYKMFLFQNRKTVCCLVFILKYSSWKHLKTHRVFFFETQEKCMKNLLLLASSFDLGTGKGAAIYIYISFFPLHDHNPLERPYQTNTLCYGKPAPLFFIVSPLYYLKLDAGYPESNEDSWIKEIFDVSVDMSSVRKTFIPDTFLHQCCQHCLHNFSVMRPKSTPDKKKHTKTPPQKHKNTTTPPQKHHHTTTKTQKQHHKNTTKKTPPQKHHHTTTKTQPHKHHHKNTTTTTTTTKKRHHTNTTTKTPPHHHKNATAPPQKRKNTTTKTQKHHHNNRTG